MSWKYKEFTNEASKFLFNRKKVLNDKTPEVQKLEILLKTKVFYFANA